MLKDFFKYLIRAPYFYMKKDFKEYAEVKKKIEVLKRDCDDVREKITKYKEYSENICRVIYTFPMRSFRELDRDVLCNQIIHCKFFYDEENCQNQNCKYYENKLHYNNIKKELANTLYLKKSFWEKKNDKLK